MTRLNAVCSLITPAAVIADVGCDHGLVAEYCIKSGLCKEVIASDISASCLKKARDRLAGVDGVRFYECDGIAYDCDEAVIAGMGGRTITDILAASRVLPETLVLCPHRDDESVRRRLNALGYTIDVETICKDRGKLYFVMRAALRGEKQVLSEKAYMFGTNYAQNNELQRELLTQKYNIYMKAPDKYAERLRLVREALHCRCDDNKK